MLKYISLFIAGLFMFFTGCSSSISQTTQSQATSTPAQAGNIIEYPDYIIYLPSGLSLTEKYPLLIALSPSADASGMIEFWKNTGEKYKWIIYASKIGRNGMDLDSTINDIASIIKKDILPSYPVDRKRIIASGFSGAGMASHAFSFLYPHIISAVIINTGMINEDYLKEDTYPGGKIAVFLASPEDFRYNEMKRDRDFLQNLGWNIKWIEFPGGHTMAPKTVYDEAVKWVEDEFDRNL
jgi:predicted esterase